MSLLNNRYVLLQQLGRGGMGTVYKAMDALLGNRFVAVKAMSQRSLNIQEVARATEAFKREADMLAHLNHQHLPRIHDYFSEGGCSFLVMDYIEGETLAEVLELSNGQGLLPEEVFLIGEQLCSVLGYLHTRQPPIIFRDIKPANVMLSGSGDHLYLIDFGIARFFKPGQVKDTLAFGTVGYAPPEQYHEQTSERSDIYSLGVTLHQLLTGHDPTRIRPPTSFPPIRAYNPQTPASLEELIMQMVETDPMKRPASMLFIKQELKRIRQGTQTAQPVPLPASLEPMAPITRSLKSITVSSPMRATQCKPLRTYRQHGDSVHAVAWAPDGKYIASGSRDKTVHVWNADTGNKEYMHKNHTSYVYGVAWSPDGRCIASASFGNVHVWEVVTGTLQVVYNGHPWWVYDVAWASSGRLIATCAADGEVHLWDAVSGNVVCKYQGYPRPVKTVAWSHGANNSRFLSGCEDGILYCWDTTTENPPVMCLGHKKEVCSTAWSPDDKRCVSGSRDRTVKIWDTLTGDVLSTYEGHKKEVYAVAWSPDGTRIASAGEDRVMRIWDVKTGSTFSTYQGHTKEIHALAWSPDGTRIASASEDKTVNIWQVS